MLMTEDASIYLPGAGVLLPRDGFQSYLDSMYEVERGYRSVSRAFLTPQGAGWLLTRTQGSSQAAEPTLDLADLWMEASIDDSGIRRVWLHYLPHSLATIRGDASTYQVEAEWRGMPVPAGWLGGAAAIVAAAERVDPYTSPLRPLESAVDARLIAFGSILLLSLAVVLGSCRWRRQVPPLACRPLVRGQLVARLREARGLR